jgi:hypothetical protein
MIMFDAGEAILAQSILEVKLKSLCPQTGSNGTVVGIHIPRSS